MAHLIVYEKDWQRRRLPPEYIDESTDVFVSRIVVEGGSGESKECDIPFIGLMIAGRPDMAYAEVRLNYVEVATIKKELQNLLDTQGQR